MTLRETSVGEFSPQGCAQLLDVGNAAFFNHHQEDRQDVQVLFIKTKHLASWSSVCRPKKLGGLGTPNPEVLNKALLLKWWVKFYTEHQKPW